MPGLHVSQTHDRREKVRRLQPPSRRPGVVRGFRRHTGNSNSDSESGSCIRQGDRPNSDGSSTVLSRSCASPGFRTQINYDTSEHACFWRRARDGMGELVHARLPLPWIAFLRHDGTTKSGKHLSEAAAKGEGDRPDHGKSCGL